MIKLDHNSMSKNPALGYYEVGGKIFWDKASALIEASTLGLKYKDIKWNFNESTFSKFDWTVEPPGDIRDWYYKRAKQIREKYDYIILNLSGGGDSTTVLYSFVNQGLLIDEVIVRTPQAGTNKWQSNNLNFSAANEFSEFEYAAKPILNWLSSVSPLTKITIHDFSKDIIDKNLIWDENFIFWSGDYVTPGCIVRYNNFSNIETIRTLDKGKKIAIVFGTDKPRVIFQKEHVNIIFVDRPVHSALPSTVTSGFTNTEVELFYWSPELPELIIKQCHLIKRWFELKENQRLSYMLNFWWQTNNLNRSAYEATIKGIIYPDYDLSTFQCNKPEKATFQEWDYWMNDFLDTTGFKTFKRGMDFLYNNIDSDFLKITEPERLPGIELNKNNWEYKPYYSKLYYLGKFKKLNGE
jgi:hypothetical protein